MNKKIVIALGGNALGDTNTEQIEAINNAATHIMSLIKEGHEVVIVHGNGPQVGKIQLAFSKGAELDKNLEEMPLPESTAMSQGYIGFHLQNSLQNLITEEGLNKNVITILTQVEVDPKDPSFKNPTKPIGPFYTLEEIQDQEHFVEDSGRGYRKVVASPKPINLVESSAIADSINNGNIVICAGGGGIPVITKDKRLNSIDAVIDKDAAASLLAQQINADMLIILTAVEKVALNYGKENETWLSTLSLEEINQYIDEGHFAPGSMLPKVIASKEFVENNPNGKAIITSLEKASDAIQDLTGTSIIQKARS